MLSNKKKGGSECQFVRAVALTMKMQIFTITTGEEGIHANNVITVNATIRKSDARCTQRPPQTHVSFVEKRGNLF
jgi:hypothetical protein